METIEGLKLSKQFDPLLIANFQDKWNDAFHQPWKPIYKTDLKLAQPYNVIDTIVHRVREYNESYDATIVGDRGLGKSAFGVGLANLLHRGFTRNPEAVFPLDQVCFDIEDWVEATQRLKGHGGGVVILDEVGTEGSLSSRTSMSKGNRATSDIIQLMRTDRIVTIYISTDRDRIDKRVRELSSVMATPIGKLSNIDTNDYGLAIEADIRFRRTKPSNNAHKSQGDTGYLVHEISPLYYCPNGRIYSIVVPHVPVDLWVGYEDKRNAKLEQVREKGLSIAQDGNAAGHEAEFQKKKKVEKGETSKKRKMLE